MAGRGTDIVLGGGDDEEREMVIALGGLYVLGTNRHESRRIDDQLRGRAGRQGDPGTSRFFISLQDDLMERYGVVALIPPAHRPPPGSEPVADPIVSREIARAQRIVEGQNFEIRRTLWKYSALVEEQRRIVAEWRQALLAGEADPGICAEAVPGALRRPRARPARMRSGAPSNVSRSWRSTIGGPTTWPRSKMSAKASICSGSAGASRWRSSTGRSSRDSSR